MLSRTITTVTATSVAPSSSVISLTAPFTRASLAKIRDTLACAVSQDNGVPDPAEPHAAVLVPFCNLNNTPGVLLEVRGKLRSHAGEVSFPGGRVDETDSSFLAAALRETHEEVGILPSQVEVIGQFGPAELSLKGLRVWPYVGFIHPSAPVPCSSRHESDTHTGRTDLGFEISDTHRGRGACGDDTDSDVDNDTPHPSISLPSLTISQPEVATVFHLPLTAFVSHARLKTRRFRGGRPYWAIDVSDFVSPDYPWDSSQSSDTHGPLESNGGRLEVWGLTGWYLSVLMKLLKVYQ